MQKNYYVVLGVSSGATLGEIKAAFRRRAMELHPDRSGSESAPFIELQEAYGVLSDPQRRRHYDEQRRPVAVRRTPWGPAPEPLIRSRPRAEPFEQWATEPDIREVSIHESFEAYHPSFDELFERLWSNFEGFTRPKAERLESLTLEVVVSADQVRRGGQVRVRIPGRATCPVCGGGGGTGRYECWQCTGAGAVAADYPVEVPFPPGIRDGYATRISLRRFGIENFYLIVLFRVGGAGFAEPWNPESPA